jgi:hypothetical protein
MQKLSYIVLILLLSRFGFSTEYYVSVQGSDGHPGTESQPFRTIQKAANIMTAGDVCFIRGGDYAESVQLKTSGTVDKPIRFIAYPGESVTIKGTDPVRTAWQVHKDNIYQTRINKPFVQLFVDDQMMVEARWPNMRFPEQLWERDCWAQVTDGSQHGKIVDPDLAETQIDWTGAIAVLNVAHQFFTWTRTVTEHEKGSDTLYYPDNLEVLASYAGRSRGWEDDRYYLFGKLKALDIPGEWYYDRTSQMLYLWTPDGKSPAEHRVETKVRNFGIQAEGLQYVEIQGLHFWACTFNFNDCDYCVVDNCHFMYPSYARRIFEIEENLPEDDNELMLASDTAVRGNHNVVKNCSFAFGSVSGLTARGQANKIENNLFHDFCWNGSLRNTALSVSGDGSSGTADDRSMVRFNTLFNLGNSILSFGNQPPQIVEYNHIYDGGRMCLDVSLVYTQLPHCRGSVVRYNWVHGVRTERCHEGWHGLCGGLGIRGDDQTRGLIVHHNVVWDCGRDGIIVKGDSNRVCNNTVFDVGKPDNPGNYVNLHTRAEPKKPWRKQWPLLPEQNVHSKIINNAALTITSSNSTEPFPPGPNMHHNYKQRDLELKDKKRFDFRPEKDSPLVDAGTIIPGMTEHFRGKAPDIGAYEYGMDRWVPGYRNSLIVYAKPMDNSKKIQYEFKLAMPVLEPIQFRIEASDQVQIDKKQLTFSPDTWSDIRIVHALGQQPWNFRLVNDEVDFNVTVTKVVHPLFGKRFSFRTIP